MSRRPRGGPAEFDVRLARCKTLQASDPSARERLSLLTSVLAYQRQRSATPLVSTAVERMVADEPTQRRRHQYPLLDPSLSVDVLATELELATAALDSEEVPVALRTCGEELGRKSAPDRAVLVEAWLAAANLAATNLAATNLATTNLATTDPAATDLAPSIGFWCHVASGPVFELAAAAVVPAPEDWNGRRCPVCAGPPRVSVIAEESVELLGGPPRSLVCGRCAAWWSFARVTCPMCGEQDPRRISGFVAPENRAVRIDGCEACRTYVKTFDLRQRGARDLVPLVDDVATVSLDLWAEAHGFRPVSPALIGM